MIPEGFYNKSRIVKKYNGGNLFHYPIRPSVFMEKFYWYTLQANETLLSVAERLFGENTDNWSVLAELNKTKRLDEWVAGDTIKIPVVLIDQNVPPLTEAVPTTPKARWARRPEQLIPVEDSGCPSVSSISVDAVTDTSITFSWGSVSQAGLYHVFIYSPNVDLFPGPFVVTNPSITFENLTPGFKYSIEVVSVCKGEESPPVSSGSVTTSEAPACSILQNLSLSVTSTSVRATFEDPNPGPPTHLYQVAIKEDSEEGGFDSINVSRLSAFFPNLQPGTTYVIRVRKICILNGELFYSSWITSNFTTLAVCGLISDLVVTNYGADFIEFSWLPGTNNTAFQIIIQDLKGNVVFSDRIEPDPIESPMVFRFSGVSPENSYTISVSGYCGDVLSGPPLVVQGSTAKVSCPIPIINVLDEGEPRIISGVKYRVINVGITVSDFSPVLHWHYLVNGVLFAEILSPFQEILLEDNSWSLTEATIGVLSDCGGYSSETVNRVIEFYRPDPSNYICPLPGITVFDVQETQMSFTFSLSDLGADVLYALRILPNGVFPSDSSATSNPVVVTGLTPGTKYELRVRTRCTDGISESFSDYRTRTIDTLSTPGADSGCPAPPFLLVGGISSTNATVSWTEVALAVGGYVILVTKVSDNSTTEYPVLSGTGSLELTGLEASTNYTVQIKSVCSGGSESGYSSAVLFTTNTSGGGGGGGDV